MEENHEMSTTITGGCACGAIRYECTEEPVVSVHCQCRGCQHFSGTGHMSLMVVPADAVTVAGAPKFYDSPADSGGTTRRGFCPDCGSPVIGNSSGMADVVFLPAGSLDDPSLFDPTVAVFTERGHAWDHLDPGLIGFPGMPPAMPGE